MAKIVTRPTQPSADQSEEIIARLSKIIETGTGGVLSSTPGAPHQLGTTVHELLDDLEQTFKAINAVWQVALFDLKILSHSNMVLELRYNEILDVLESVMDVSYDEALDHATADLMDAFCSSGSAETNADGELEFDSRVVFSKGDLKPILREAINRWVELKTQ